MKTLYQNFSELADDFKDGAHITHTLSAHDDDDCLAWQLGVREFAAWLDKGGIKVPQTGNLYDRLWADD